MPGESGDPRPIRWVKWIAAVAGAITAVVGVLVFFWPNIKPAEPCRGSLNGTLTKATVDASVTYRAYLELVGGSAGQASAQRLNESGKLVRVKVHTEGYKGKELPIRWWFLTAGGEPVPEPNLTNQLAMTISPNECNDNGSPLIWAGPTPRRRGRYLVEVRLQDTHGQDLSSIRTSPFAGRVRRGG